LTTRQRRGKHLQPGSLLNEKPGSNLSGNQQWITAVGAKTAYIAPGSPWENGFIESFNARLRDELLDGEIFYSLAEAKIVIESWRRHYNTVRPHGSLGYKPPAPEVFVPAMTARSAPQPRPSESRPPPALASRPSMH
jgi:transposase InsO family protein